MKLETMKVLVVSTKHITSNDNEMLETFSGPDELDNLPSGAIRSAEDEYGYFVWSGRSDNDISCEGYCKEALEAGYSKELVNLLKLSVEEGHDYVRIDRDGPVYKELPSFEW